MILQSPPAGYTYKPQLWTMVLTNTGKGSPVVLLPAEVALLAAGPFTRRQLLAYKLWHILVVLAFISMYIFWATMML